MKYKPKPKEPKVTKAIYIKERYVEELTKIAIENNMNFSNIIEDMIAKFLEEKEK